MAKRIVILGAGESGAGAAVLAKKQGFDTFVSDMSAIKENYKAMLNERGIAWEEKKHTEDLILNADEVIKSPGIPNEAPIIMKLKEQGTPIISEIEFAGRYTNAKMICITGSNGKTTTTSLIYHIFKKAGLNVGLAGNIGQSLAYQVAECNYDYYVIELSSFQLDNMYEFHANIAVMMNITPDHLDRYEYKMQNYVDSKFRIIQNQTEKDAFIFWNDDPIIQKELHKYGIHGQYYPFAENKKENEVAYLVDDKVHFTEPISFNMEQEELALTGKHNLFNSMAAGISANIAGVKVDAPNGEEKFVDTSTDVGVITLDKVGTYTVRVSTSGEEKVYRVYSAAPAGEGDVTAIGGSFSIVGEQTFEKTDGQYDPLVLIFILMAVVMTADWMVYCYEKYQLR